ncbi:hypothetical protein BDN72DRAFT_860975 [Pluteus cervinus]|uniref:Uncharacterized protein n=1 Tax=Pluteus cervinus TaxID=181527 RepID=A0ACD3AGF1_9AGAR|nr:hypothetical protein BDN72DRAFT_860975 [Pluteus cervinus]
MPDQEVMEKGRRGLRIYALIQYGILRSLSKIESPAEVGWCRVGVAALSPCIIESSIGSPSGLAVLAVLSEWVALVTLCSASGGGHLNMKGSKVECGLIVWGLLNFMIAIIPSFWGNMNGINLRLEEFKPSVTGMKRFNLLYMFGLFDGIENKKRSKGGTDNLVHDMKFG